MYSPSDRPALKAHARAAMKKASPGVYAVSLLFVVINLLPGIVTAMPILRNVANASSPEEILQAYTSTQVSGSMLLSLLTFIMQIFLALVSAGYSLYCLRLSRGEEPGGVQTLFACFREFWRFTCVIVVSDLFITLWSFLLVIPGIIAAYSYSQAILLMFDHPSMTAFEAIRESKQLMRGHKMELFILQLSFVGWSILAGLTMGILGVWLMPYMQTTAGAYYDALIGKPAARNFSEPSEGAEDRWWENQG